MHDHARVNVGSPNGGVKVVASSLVHHAPGLNWEEAPLTATHAQRAGGLRFYGRGEGGRETVARPLGAGLVLTAELAAGR